MTLSEDDKDWVKLMSTEVVREVLKEVIREHIASCPYGKFLSASKWFVIGLIVGPGIVGGGAGFAVAKLLAGM